MDGNHGSIPCRTRMGQSDKTEAGRRTAITYIDMYLRDVDTNFPDSLHQLTHEHIEGDHLLILLESFGLWLARTAFFTRQNSWLSNGVKEEYFKNAKEVFKQHFPRHHLFYPPHQLDWFSEMKKRFLKECDRSRIEDPSVSEQRKSEPLYRDLSTNKTAVRAKYLNDSAFDAKSVAMSMIKKGDKNNGRLLLEFNITRQAIGRGGEHAFLRWNEANFDYFFDAPDFDWSIIKQASRQCMLLFCDCSLYCLCPFFSFGIFFLFGGLRRDGVSDTIKDFVFFYLHKLRKEGVATRLTEGIRANIDASVARKKCFTSRSTRKAAMTENRLHRDLSIKEEYCRSGHTAPEMNSNAEGYIESTPALNAPGGLAMAGYSNCHIRVRPFSFDCLGLDVADAVLRLVSELFINDVPELQPSGKLRPVLITSAARLIGSYNDLVRDVKIENGIVIQIMQAARRANIEDKSLAHEASGPRWMAVLKAWSRRIFDDFKTKNPEVVSEDSSISHQIVGLGTQVQRYGRKIEEMEAQMQGLVADKATAEYLRDSNKLLMQQIEQLKKENSRLKRVNTALQSPVSSPNRRLWVNPEVTQPLENASMSEDILVETESNDSLQAGQPVSKKARASALSSPPMDDQGPPNDDVRILTTSVAPPMDDQGPPNDDVSKPTTSVAVGTTTPAVAALDGIANVQQSLGGITLTNELERLWSCGAFKKHKLFPKIALYDRKHAMFVGVHPVFQEKSEGSKYQSAMTLVSMAVEESQMDAMRIGDLDCRGTRELCVSVVNQTMAVAYQLEVETDLRKPGSKSKNKSTLHSLGTRFNAILKKWKDMGKSALEIETIISEKTGVTGKKQTFVNKYFGTS